MNEKLEVAQGSATVGTLQEVAAKWLRAGCDHTLQMYMEQVPAIASPFSPTAICGFYTKVGCTQNVLHAAETWARKVDTLNRLRHNERAMIC